MPSATDFVPSVTTIVHEPFAVGVTVYVAGSVVPPPAIVATGAQPAVFSPGAVVVSVDEIENVCEPLPGAANVKLLGEIDTEPVVVGVTGPVGPAGTVCVPPEPDDPPPQPASAKTTMPRANRATRARIMVPCFHRYASGRRPEALKPKGPLARMAAAASDNPNASR